MKIVSPDTYFETVGEWNHVPFCQYKSWVEAQQTNQRQVVCFLDEQIGSVGYVKKRAGIKWLFMESPATNDVVSVTQRKQFYEAIREQGYTIIELNDRMPYDAETEIALRQAGYLRPVGSFSYQLSDYIDLTQPVAFNENWRRNLKKADSAGLELDFAANVSATDIRDLWALYQQMSANKQLALPFSQEYLTILLRDPRFRLYFVKQGDSRIAAIIVHTSGTHSGLLYAANGEQANELHAGYWMYSEVLKDLAQSGYQTFDMEKLAPSIHSTNSVFQFKQGIKGELTSLNGEWQWSKRPWLALAMFILKKYRLKRPQA